MERITLYAFIVIYCSSSDPLPPPAIEVKTNHTTTSSVVVSWGVEADQTHATGFKVYQSLSGAQEKTLVLNIVTSNDQIHTLSGLSPGTNYTIEVYSITIDSKESLEAASVEATVSK